MFSRAELRAIPIFSELSDGALDFLIGHSADMRFLAGEYVLHEGDTTRAFFVLVDGQLQVTKFVNGDEPVIGTRTPGATFDELPLILGTPLAVNFRASKDARVLRLDAREYKTLTESAPNLPPLLESLTRDRIEGLQEIAAASSAPALAVIGPQWDNQTHEIREFLERNAIDFEWIEATDARADYPEIRLRDGTTLIDPTTRRLAGALGLNCSPKQKQYDVAILGGGPAGLAAAVYGASEGLSTVLIEREAPGGQAGTSSRIENYLGFPYGIAGGDLAHRALEQAKRLGAEIVVTRNAHRIDPVAYTVFLDDDESLVAGAIVLAMGVAWRHLAIPALDRLRGRGVYYGAAPDEVRSTNGQDVFIVGAGNSAGQAAINFANYARSVTLLVRGDSLAKSMSRYLIDQLATKTNVQIALRTEVVDASGETHLETLDTIDAATNTVSRHPAGALFIMIGADAETDWLPSEIRRDANGYVLTGAGAFATGDWPLQRNPYILETVVPGIFAVGDVRSDSIKRVAAAVGEGSMSIALVHQYMANA